MKWTEAQQTGTLPLARSSHTISYVSQKAYLLGGEHKPRYGDHIARFGQNLLSL